MFRNVFIFAIEFKFNFVAKIVKVLNMERKNLQKIDEIKMRLLQFAKEQKLIMGDFYEKISLSPSNFSGKGLESSLKSENIVTVLKVYPELSPDWLLLEKGEMLRKNNGKNVNVIESPQTNISNGDMNISAPVELVALLTSQQETIKMQAETINSLLVRTKDKS